MRTLFPNPDEVVPFVMADRLMAAVSVFMPGIEIDPGYVYQQILSAESDIAHRLRVLLVPHEILPDGTDPAVLAELDAQGIPWLTEPPYDMVPGQYANDKWGYLICRQKPVIEVLSVSYHYPVPNNLVWTMPNDWIRVDKKYGHLQFVPTGTPVTAPLSAYVLGAMAHGRTIPQMIRVRYRAGMEDAFGTYPELKNLIVMKAVLNVLDGWFIPQSGSISADGLSQSFSMDMDRHKNAIDGRLEALRSFIHGQRMIFL
jgi:hypothetical protein